MSFCPFLQDKECSSNCAIWSKEGLCCSLLRIPSEIHLVAEKINDAVVELIQLSERL
jgi:hypothetical protein